MQGSRHATVFYVKENKNMRKIIFTMIVVLLSTLSMSAQDDVYMSPQRDSVEQETQVESQRKLTRKEQKRLQEQIDSIQYEQAMQAIRDTLFTLEANRVVFKYGQRAYVTSFTNFVAVNKEKATIQVAFNIPVARPNGMGGVTVEGTLNRYELKTDRKGNPILSFYVQGIAISAQVYITLWQGSNSASVTINPNFNSNRITLEGTLLPSCLSNVVKGRAI